ncbi:MAG: hypothetical protein AB1847_15925 [bacterium]
MKKVFRSLVISGLLALSLCHYSSAEHWEKVAGNGFGESSNDYAWSMCTFQKKLYVGTLNTLRGGEIWCSATGVEGSWKKVYDSRHNGNLGIRNLYSEDDKALFACTVSSKGADILRTTNGQKWTAVVKGSESRDAPALRCITRFGEYLYAGAGSGIGAQLYRSKDGLNWSLVETKPAFTSTMVYDPNIGIKVRNNTMIGELSVFRNQLYAFTWSRVFQYQDVVERMLGCEMDRVRERPLSSSSPGAFEVWRSSNGLNWEKVVGLDDPYGNGMGFCNKDPFGLTNDVVTSSLVFKGQLYLGTMNDNAHSAIWKTSDGTHWTKVLDFFDLGETGNYYVWRMVEFQDKLFIGTMNVGPAADPGVTGGQIWASEAGDPGTFYNLVHNGFDGETWTNGTTIEIPKNIGIRTFGVFNNALYAGTATIISAVIPKEDGSDDRRIIAGNDIGCEIWRMKP